MIKNLIALSAFLVGSLAVAHATTITQISIDGSDTWSVSGSNGTITFANPASVGAGATGNFAVFTSADNDVILFPAYSGGPLPFSLGFQTVASRLGVPDVLALTTTQGSNTLDFYVSDYSVSLVSDVTGCSENCLDITGDGFFTETGYPQLNGSFTFTTQATDTTGDTEVTFSATGFETPEPAPLALLGTGLLGLVALGRRRFAL